MSWYVYTEGQQYGPYDLGKMQQMVLNRQIVGETQVFQEGMTEWVNASTVEELFPLASVDGGTDAAKINKKSKRKKEKKPKKPGRKFLIFLGVLLGIVVVVVGIVVLMAEGIIFKNHMMDLDKKNKWVQTSVESSGGLVTVADPMSPVAGLTIEVPDGAYIDGADFEINTRDIKSHKYGEFVTPITPLIEVKNGGEYSEVPMMITIPIEKTDDQFAMAFYYNDDGTLEPMPTVSLTNDAIVVASRHFSEFVVTLTEIALLGTCEVETNFKPGIDDWSFSNTGSEAAKGGFCLGSSLTAAYYYDTVRDLGGVPLRDFLDNNHGISTPANQFDDSLGVRLVSKVQLEFDDYATYYSNQIEKYHEKKSIPDDHLYLGLAYAMKVTGNPQLMFVYVRDVVNGKVVLNYGHALIAYRIGHEGIYISDPNYIGNQSLYIPYANGTFGNYNTSTSTNSPSYDYNSFSHVSGSALFNWNEMYKLFKEVGKNPNDYTIGDAHFATAGYRVSVLNSKDELEFVDPDETIELDPKDKNELKEAIEEALIASGIDASAYPADWDSKDYLLAEIYAETDTGQYGIYKGTATTPLQSGEITRDEDVYAFLPLDAGANNLGILLQERIVENGKNVDLLIDFRRTQIINGETDLTGIWEGTIFITNDEKARKYLKRVFEPFIRGVLDWWGGIVDKTYTEAEIQKIIEESVDLKEQFKDGIPMAIELSNKDGDKYKAKVIISFSETPVVYETDAELKRGSLQFDFVAVKRLKFIFDLDLYDNSTLEGDYDTSWMIMKNFIQGEGKFLKK